LLGEIDAVALPLNIFVESIDKLANVILVNWEPSPTKNEPDVTIKLPLTFIEPVNWEPLSADWTLNPKFGVTEAVTDADAILNGAIPVYQINFYHYH
jgi:hypothetical protein